MSHTAPASRPRRTLVRSRRVLSFVVGYVLHFLRSNYDVAKEILTPGSQLAPAVVTVPLQSRTRAEIATYMSLVNLSPGTITLALSQDRTELTVHGMHAEDPTAFREELQSLESQMILAWRPVAAPRSDPESPSQTDSPRR